MLPSIEENVHATIKTMFHYLHAQGQGDYLGEKVSQLEHSLQAAQLALDAKASDDTVLGALLHDIGRFIPAAEKKAAMLSADGVFVGRESHEVEGEKYLRALGFSDTICQLVGAHVMAKRYLTAVDSAYYDGLSQSSKTTLKYQVRSHGVLLRPLGRSYCSNPLTSGREVFSRTIKCAKPRRTRFSKRNWPSADGTTRPKCPTCRLSHWSITSQWLNKASLVGKPRPEPRGHKV
jgi:predicted HD phosphohydrolase